MEEISQQQIAEESAAEESAAMQTATEVALEESKLANELSLEQQVYGLERQAENIAREGTEYRHPSYFKYTILMSLAILSDGLDLLTFTGIGIVIAFFTSLFLNSSIYAIAWFTNTKYHRARSFTKIVEKRVEELNGQLAALQRNIAHTARVAKFFIGKKGTAAVITKGAGTLAKVLKNVCLVVEVIPLLDFGFLPLTIVSVGLAYWDERVMYKNAAKAGEDASGQISISAAEMV